MGNVGSPTIAQSIGLDDSLLVDCDGQRLHRDVIGPWRTLQASASSAGFELAIASAYRSYDRQLRIWNEKAEGIRPVLDGRGQALAVEHLDDSELLFAILRYSALPGASRHHWGTDVDIYDRSAVDADYVVQLTEAEVDRGGPFAPMHDWLDAQFAADQLAGFFRPYCGQNALAAERWHLSYRPVADVFVQVLRPEQLYQHYEQAQGLALRQVVLDNFDVIYRDYICCE